MVSWDSMYKICKTCKLIKNHSNFYNDRRNNDGLYSSCSTCQTKYISEYNKIPENLIKKRLRSNAYDKKRKLVDPQYKISVLLRIRMCSALKKGYKKGSGIRYIGCSVIQLKEYLEKKFQPGMTWSNHGKWHIDHIIPLCSFDLTDKKQFLKAVHYTNLQPLWAVDNLKKSRGNYKLMD